MNTITDANQNARIGLVSKRIANCGKVNVREEPSGDAKILTTLWCGDHILAEPTPVGDYYKVRIRAKEYGYIHKNYVL